MQYYVMQFWDFFVLKKVKGYTGNYLFLGTKISKEEYTKLYYSSEKKKIVHSKPYVQIRIQGNACTILNKKIQGACKV